MNRDINNLCNEANNLNIHGYESNYEGEEVQSDLAVTSEISCDELSMSVSTECHYFDDINDDVYDDVCNELDNTIDYTNNFLEDNLIVHKHYDTKSYVDFLNDKIQTENGKFYSDICNYSEEELENDHRFIQWIFPTTTQSSCAFNVPIIDIIELREYINHDPTIIDKIKRSHEMMINHWGLNKLQNPSKINKLNGHDALRLSRMLQSLVYHNLKSLALFTYEVVSQHIGYPESILNPRIYSYNDENGKYNEMDAWKYHLFEAFREYDSAFKSEH